MEYQTILARSVEDHFSEDWRGTCPGTEYLKVADHETDLQVDGSPRECGGLCPECKEPFCNYDGNKTCGGADCVEGEDDK